MQSLIEQLQHMDIVHINIPNPIERQKLHIEKDKNYLLRSAYKPSVYEVKCNGCGRWNSTQGAQNSCCDGDDESSHCTNTYVRVRCKYCKEGENGYGWIFWDASNVPKEITGGKVRNGGWKATGEMIFLKNGTSYKHLNSSDLSYRKKYCTK